MIPASQWASAWSEHESTTIQQAAAAEKDLEAWLNGAPHASFDPFRRLLELIDGQFQSLLEIGSGWGGYCQVLKHIDPDADYCGCDISHHMINYSVQRWGPMFFQSDSSLLCAETSSFDVTCISGLIQHLADYRPSIREAVRVSRKYVMLHRVECTSAPSYEFIRRAYDSDVPTRRVNQGELLKFCQECGLKILGQETWSVGPSEWNASFLLEKP